jgi:hypothetical protein
VLLGQLILMCLNETFSKFHVRQDLMHFLFRIVWNDVSSPLLFNYNFENRETLLYISKEIGVELNTEKI